MGKSDGDQYTMTIEEFARAFRLHIKSAYKLARHYPETLPVPPIKVGSSIRFSRVAVESLIGPTKPKEEAHV
ncbi:MAG TPA: helix-turn-helix domain-containing protein [Thermomicrobiales bacterium]|nr:helix-turn-helix domain-containing protein [Thermomicrobiales bacterium]